MDLDWINEQMEKRGRGARSALAEHLGIGNPAVTEMLSGRRQLKLTEAQKIAEFFGVRLDIRSEDVADDLPEPPPKKAVKIRGYVGAGSETHFYRYADEDYETVEPPAGATDQTIAVVIKGKSWGPMMDGWVVFYDDVRSPVTDDLLGYPCIVGLADDRILLKTPKRDANGLIDLYSNSDEPPIVGAEIEWAAKVIGFRPR